MGCDIKYLGAPSCLAYAGSFIVYSPSPPLEPHLCANFSRYRANFFATAEISISPPLPPTKSHISTVPPCFPSSNLHCCLLAAQPPRRRPFFLQRHLLASYPSSCNAASLPVTLVLAASPPRRRSFFLLRGLLAANPSSYCAASSIWSGNPHPTHTILLLSRPTCPD